MVEQGEAYLRGLGFRVFRVRHVVEAGQPVRARVLIAPEEMERVPELRSLLEGGLKAVGYAGVEIDPRGYRAA